MFNSNLDFQKATANSDNICVHCDEIVEELSMDAHWKREAHMNKEFASNLFFFHSKNNSVSFWCTLCSKEINPANVCHIKGELISHFTGKHNFKDLKRTYKFDLMLSAPPQIPNEGGLFEHKSFAIKVDGARFECKECPLKMIKFEGLYYHLKTEHAKVWNSYQNPNKILTTNWALLPCSMQLNLKESQKNSHAQSMMFHFQTVYENSPLKRCAIFVN
jgi:hypothetical protein